MEAVVESINRQSPEDALIENQLSLNNLSDKEREVLDLILRKNSHIEVAKELGVDVRTIFNRVSSIENKARRYQKRQQLFQTSFLRIDQPFTKDFLGAVVYYVQILTLFTCPI
ncbi:hypothetical protein CWO17_11480 [Vibrio sp. 10N.286.45.A3]|uniref:hypothetical protein n=1 Tax=Vibrio TaxID=662 RepID=UPI00076A4561|nr:MULTISPECIES: hypothetical protein [Vibrio]PHX04448.1 hypothetical protein VSPL_39880 [Vibrio splendidus]PTP05037.1 hypothetical protein CWO17_11480 [Vibrio sp. 10N.286.45.A3]TKE74693.1 hypothetical protein FCV56_23520 [Vibrio sp. F12]TKE96212.1 hypothetical protein FCV61_16260 [Vibrio sp. F12]